MNSHLRTQLDHLKVDLLELSSLVEESVKKAVNAVQNFDETLAQQVISNDDKIDRMEVDLEEKCLQILALHQPVAIDLRFVVSALKINNDLERIGDLSANISRRVKYLVHKKQVEAPFDIEDMATKTSTMLKNSLNSLIHMDTKLANEVGLADKEVDNINRQVYNKVFDGIHKNPENAEELIHYLSISRNLERIADYSTNIAEDVIYMVDGVIVRHGVLDHYS